MVSSVSSNSTTTATPITSASASSSLVTGSAASLGESDFLKLLIEQLKNQDPLQPQDDSSFVAQLAQFSTLEQSMQTNSALTTMTSVLQGQSNAQVTSLVGKVATIQGRTISLDGSGTGAQATFSLSGPSSATTATIQDSSGNTVRTLNLGPQSAGLVNFTWDGRNSSGDLQPSGSYTITISATSSTGGAVAVTQDLSGTVTGVSFDQGYPVLNLQNGVSAPVSELLRVDSPQTSP